MSAVEIEGLGVDNAVLLLSAAEELGLEPSVVQTTSTGFLVPKEVADKAGLDYESDEDDEPAPAKKPVAKKTAAKKSEE